MTNYVNVVIESFEAYNKIFDKTPPTYLIPKEIYKLVEEDIGTTDTLRRASCHTTDDVTVINGENQETKGIVQTKEVGTLQSGTLIG